MWYMKAIGQLILYLKPHARPLHSSIMAQSGRLDLKKGITQYYSTTGRNIKSRTLNHFIDEGVSRSTIYRTLATNRATDLPRSGHPVRKATKRVVDG